MRFPRSLEPLVNDSSRQKKAVLSSRGAAKLMYVSMAGCPLWRGFPSRCAWSFWWSICDSRSRRPGVEKTVTGIIELPERLNKGGRSPEELSVKSLTSTFYCNKIQCMQHMHVTHKSPILTIYVDLYYGKVGLVGWLVEKVGWFFKNIHFFHQQNDPRRYACIWSSGSGAQPTWRGRVRVKVILVHIFGPVGSKNSGDPDVFF